MKQCNEHYNCKHHDVPSHATACTQRHAACVRKRLQNATGCRHTPGFTMPQCRPHGTLPHARTHMYARLHHATFPVPSQGLTDTEYVHTQTHTDTHRHTHKLPMAQASSAVRISMHREPHKPSQCQKLFSACSSANTRHVAPPKVSMKSFQACVLAERMAELTPDYKMRQTLVDTGTSFVPALYTAHTAQETRKPCSDCKTTAHTTSFANGHVAPRT